MRHEQLCEEGITEPHAWAGACGRSEACAAGPASVGGRRFHTTTSIAARSNTVVTAHVWLQSTRYAASLKSNMMCVKYLPVV